MGGAALKINSLVLALAVAGPVSALAQEVRPTCGAMDADIPAPYAAWNAKAEVTSAADAAGLDMARLTPGRAATAKLHPTRQVAYTTQPEKPGGSVASGGMLALDIVEAGTYRVGVSSGAWLDLMDGGKAVVSTAHGEGPACTTLRKMVDFPLHPGRYVVQISANAEPTIGILVIKSPGN